jgi:predicted DNA-binding transcriptional regulator AlpA
MKVIPNKDMLSSYDLAQLLGLSNSCCRRMIKSGVFATPIQLGNTGRRIHWRVRRSDFIIYLERQGIFKEFMPPEVS